MIIEAKRDGEKLIIPELKDLDTSIKTVRISIDDDLLTIKDKEVISDEYIENNWRQLLMSCKSDTDYHKSKEYYDDRGSYLEKKYE